MGRFRHALVTCVCLAGCGSDKGLSDYFPKLPPTGGAQQVYAGQVTDPSQLLTGPAQSGLVGDFFIKNAKATFIIQADKDGVFQNPTTLEPADVQAELNAKCGI